jgi:2-amino-4-hydroxy-6-hydroxymethyldihydropteridine diphosphokinase
MLMPQAFIGIGSNLGESVRICRDAIEQLGMHPELTVLKVSSLYRTKPLLNAAQPWFINGVLQCRTNLDPEGLLGILQSLENRFGRVREVRWGPRTLDLDILSYGEDQVALPSLQIPHPRIQERRFVLEPLYEIAPEWVHPTLQLSASQMLEHLANHGETQEVERLESI